MHRISADDAVAKNEQTLAGIAEALDGVRGMPDGTLRERVRRTVAFVEKMKDVPPPPILEEILREEWP